MISNRAVGKGGFGTDRSPITFWISGEGRSGLAWDPPTNKVNVWEVDCSSLFPPGIGGMDIHSAYFDSPCMLA